MAPEAAAGRAAAQPDIDLAAVAERVLRSLGPGLDRDEVDALLTEQLGQLLPDARVTQYLPIFLHRRACDTLRARARRVEAAP